MSEYQVLLTIGHSDRPLEEFLGLLAAYRIDTLVDLRSSPYSRHAPSFNRESLRAALGPGHVHYIFLGDALGGRPPEDWLYDDKGRVLYYLVAQLPRFVDGIARLEAGESQGRNIMLMCSEGDPTECHRHLLVSRVLHERGHRVAHVTRDDHIVTYEDAAQNVQTSLLAEEDRAWISTRSVSHRNQPRGSSGS